MCVCVCVCLHVCVIILQRAFLHNRNEFGNENCNATTTRHLVTVWCAHHDGPLSVIESSVKSKLLRINYLSCWKVNLYHKIDGDPNRLQNKHVKALHPWPGLTLAHAQIVHCWYCINKSSCIHSLLLLFCLSTESCSLTAWIAMVTCMHAVKYKSCMLCAQDLCNLHWGISMLVLSIDKVYI